MATATLYAPNPVTVAGVTYSGNVTTSNAAVISAIMAASGTLLSTPEPTVQDSSANYRAIIAAASAAQYSTAQLRNMSAAEAKLVRIAPCSDCITPNGIGSLVEYSDAFGWRIPGTAIGLMTNMIDYFRACASACQDVRGTYDLGVFDDATLLSRSGFGSVTAAQNGGSSTTQQTTTHTGFEWRLGQIGVSTGGTNATGGARMSSQAFARPAALYGAGFYMAAEVIMSALSTSAQEYSFRIGFDDGVSSTYGVPTNGLFLAYDRGNAYGSNGSNLDFWQAINRNGGTASTTISAVTPSIDKLLYNLVEVYVPPTMDKCEYYIDGNLIASISTNVPASSFLRAQMTILKSVGTTERFAQYDWVYLHARRAAAFPHVGVVI